MLKVMMTSIQRGKVIKISTNKAKVKMEETLEIMEIMRTTSKEGEDLAEVEEVVEEASEVEE